MHSGSLGGSTLLCCLLSVVVMVVQCQVDWRQLPYTDNSFNVDAKFDTNVTLQCNDSTLPDDFKFLYWIRPDTTVMLGNDVEQFRILDGYAAWQVSADGMQMRVISLQQKQFGLYLCVGQVEDNNGVLVTKVTKRGLNYEAPYFGDLWLEYKTNTIIGLSAGGGFLLIVAIVTVTYHFRYMGPDEDEDEDQDSEVEMVQTEQVSTIATSAGGTGGDSHIYTEVF